MKKYLPALLISLLALSSASSQDGLTDFSKSYFRVNPFSGEFSSFLKLLLNDPSIREKQIRQRTDTSLFYFSGNYTSYNRFFFKPTQVRIALEQIPVQYSENELPDTIFVYSLLAYADSTKSGEQDVKKEFAKIHRLFHKKFDENNYQDFQSGEAITGGVHNYFVNRVRLAPVSIAWGKAETNQYALSLVLRIKAISNQAVLPVVFDQP